MAQQWVVLTYRARRDPSRHRVAVWRQLKAVGALYLQDSVCALPDTGEHRTLLEELAEDVRRNDGQAMVLLAQGLGDSDEQYVIDAFNAERDQDYAEVVKQCTALLDDIGRERESGRFSWGELEDVEGNLDRLRTWMQRIQDRDFFHASGGATAASSLTGCDEACGVFAAEVVARSEITRGDGPAEELS